jgi:hypothetical protein
LVSWRALEKTVLDMFGLGAIVAEPTKTPRFIRPRLSASRDRESLNQRFALRQRAGARIDESSFQEHLRTTVNDLIHAVVKVQPE